MNESELNQVLDNVEKDFGKKHFRIKKKRVAIKRIYSLSTLTFIYAEERKQQQGKNIAKKTNKERKVFRQKVINNSLQEYVILFNSSKNITTFNQIQNVYCNTQSARYFSNAYKIL